MPGATVSFQTRIERDDRVAWVGARIPNSEDHTHVPGQFGALSGSTPFKMGESVVNVVSPLFRTKQSGGNVACGTSNGVPQMRIIQSDGSDGSGSFRPITILGHKLFQDWYSPQTQHIYR